MSRFFFPSSLALGLILAASGVVHASTILNVSCIAGTATSTASPSCSAAIPAATAIASYSGSISPIGNNIISTLTTINTSVTAITGTGE